MSSFNEPLIVEKVKKRLWKVHREFTYHVGTLQSKDSITVPEGFVTDFASVPRFFWRILPPDGQYTQAAVLHDYLYSIRGIDGQEISLTRKECDAIFKEAMIVLNVAKWKRWTMWKAVRDWGWIAWKNKIPGAITIEEVTKKFVE